jgi:predicted NUDIX family phosphoesterase
MEFVFVVPRSELFPACSPHGLQVFGDGDEAVFRDRVAEHGFFVERAYAERTSALKQVIPYNVVVRDGEVLCLRRSKQGGEARLHDKLSIGVGGHINPIDLPAPGDAPGSERRDPIPAATRREVAEEELEIEGEWSARAIGILNDDSNPVGAVHVGLVQVLEVHGAVAVSETEQLSGQFASVRELTTMLAGGANFETWSSLLIPHLGHILREPAAARGFTR